MAKATRVVKQWSKDEEKTLVKLVRAGESTNKIARALKRTPASIRSKAQKQSLSLSAVRSRVKPKAGAKAKKTR